MKIHLNSRNGVYTVKSYNNTYINLVTKHYEMRVPCTDFKCFAGGSNNTDVTAAESDRFLSVVNPAMFAHQQKIVNTIKEYAYKIDELDTKIAELKDAPIHDEIDDHVEEDDIDPFDSLTNTQYENWYYQKSEELIKYRDKIRKCASEVYKQKNLDFSDLQIHDGIKFIIQANHDETDYRFCFDPFGFVDNYHSAISNIYREYGYGTINGGWIKVIGKNVILYYKSGDYGVYDDAIAIEAAKKLFPNHNISSYAGRQWDDELTVKYDDLPF